MPTPRHVTGIAKQVAAPAINSASPAPDAWVAATILRVVGGLNSTYETRGEDGKYSYYSTSSIDAAFEVGDEVWVVRTGTQAAVIVGFR